MPYANNNGVKIYYEVEGQGPPLTMAHGVTRSLEIWHQIGFVSALKNDYRLILFDARGHGKSNKPHNPTAYGINMIGDVLTVLHELNVERTNYLGYSLGGAVGLATTVSHPERFNSLILGGWSPYRPQPERKIPSEGVPQPRVLLRQDQHIMLLRSDPDAFLRSREEQLGRPLTDDEKIAELANDPEALSALMAAFRDIGDVATLGDQELERISLPCLLYAGNLDPAHSRIKRACTQLPQARFFSLPGLNHWQAGRSDLILPIVKEFLAEATKDQAD